MNIDEPQLPRELQCCESPEEKLFRKSLSRGEGETARYLARTLNEKAKSLFENPGSFSGGAPDAPLGSLPHLLSELTKGEEYIKRRDIELNFLLGDDDEKLDYTPSCFSMR